MTKVQMQQNKKVGTFYYIKIKICVGKKATISKLKRQMTNWKEIFIIYIRDKGPIFLTYKEYF